MMQTKLKSTETLREIDGANLIQALKPKPGSKLPSGMLWWMPFLLGVFLGAGVMDYVNQQIKNGVAHAICK